MGGDFDVILLVRAVDNIDLRRVTFDQLQSIPGVLDTRTFFVFEDATISGEIEAEVPPLVPPALATSQAAPRQAQSEGTDLANVLTSTGQASPLLATRTFTGRAVTARCPVTGRWASTQESGGIGEEVRLSSGRLEVANFSVRLLPS